MQSPPPNPPVSDLAPTDGNLTGYDQQHLVTQAAASLSRAVVKECGA
jgi:hypothetical protein